MTQHLTGSNRHVPLLARLLFALMMSVMGLNEAGAATEEFELIIKDHLFFPSVLEVPAGVKIRLRIINQDPTPEEFESYELNREKVIAANRETVIFIGPLQPGEYPFFGEFYPRTAQGKVVAK